MDHIDWRKIVAKYCIWCNKKKLENVLEKKCKKNTSKILKKKIMFCIDETWTSCCLWEWADNETNYEWFIYTLDFEKKNFMDVAVQDLSKTEKKHFSLRYLRRLFLVFIIPLVLYLFISVLLFCLLWLVLSYAKQWIVFHVCSLIKLQNNCWQNLLYNVDCMFLAADAN